MMNWLAVATGVKAAMLPEEVPTLQEENYHLGRRTKSLAIAVLILLAIDVVTFALLMYLVRGSIKQDKADRELAVRTVAEAKQKAEEAAFARTQQKELLDTVLSVNIQLRDCNTPEGQCYKEALARQDALVNSLKEQHAAQVRQIARTRTQVEQKVTEKAEETKTKVETKTEEVKQEVREIPPEPSPKPTPLVCVVGTCVP